MQTYTHTHTYIHKYVSTYTHTPPVKEYSTLIPKRADRGWEKYVSEGLPSSTEWFFTDEDNTYSWDRSVDLERLCHTVSHFMPACFHEAAILKRYPSARPYTLWEHNEGLLSFKWKEIPIKLSYKTKKNIKIKQASEKPCKSRTITILKSLEISTY